MIWDFLYQGENIQKSRPLKKNAKQIYLQVTSEGVALICCFFVKISQIFSCRTFNFFCYHNKKYLSELICQINSSNVYLEGFFLKESSLIQAEITIAFGYLSYFLSSKGSIISEMWYQMFLCVKYLMWRFCGNKQFPLNFEQFARNAPETPNNLYTGKLDEITVFKCSILY